MTREFHVEFHEKNDIARVAKRRVRYRFFEWNSTWNSRVGKWIFLESHSGHEKINKANFVHFFKAHGKPFKSKCTKIASEWEWSCSREWKSSHLQTYLCFSLMLSIWGAKLWSNYRKICFILLQLVLRAKLRLSWRNVDLMNGKTTLVRRENLVWSSLLTLTENE